jgi:hypothetical protein
MRSPRPIVLLSLGFAGWAGVAGIAGMGLGFGAPAPPAPPAPPARPTPTPPRTAPPAGVLRFTRLNRVYSQPAAADPIVDGPFTVRISSPRNRMVLASNALRLEPGADGLYTADLEVRFYGKGRVVADVDVSGIAKQHLEDEVVVPPQTRRLEGRVRVTRDPDGYLILPERLPKELPIAFQSQLGNDLVGLCERFASLPFSTLDCSGLDRALTTAAVPLPPGQGFYLARADLTPDERREIDAYVQLPKGGRR